MQLGLADLARCERLAAKTTELSTAIALLSSHRVAGVTLLDRLKRPEFDWGQCVAALPSLQTVSRETATQIENDVRYAGYVLLEREQIQRRNRVSQRPIPVRFDYAQVQHLRAEAREKLNRVRPQTLAQAGRISGVTPADLAIVLLALEGRAGGA